MPFLRRCLAVVLVLSVTSGVWAMDAPAPKVEPVITHIPAGSLGFVVIPSASGMAGKVDKFVTDLGLGQFLSQPDPQDPDKMVQMSVLHLLKGLAQLGDGFNPAGGVAAVMLDPKAYDIDLTKMLNLGGGDQMAPGEQPKVPPKLPFVIFVPGSGIEETFGAYKMEPAGKHTLIHLRMGPTYAAKVGGYVALSPNDKALDAALSAPKKAPAELPAEHLKALAQGDLGYYVDMKLVAPIIVQMFGQIEEQIVMQAGPVAPIMGVYMGFYKEIIRQLDAVTVAGRFVEGGLVFEELVRFKPDSAYGKAIAATKPTPAVQLNRLPDLPYVLAGGEAINVDEQSRKVGMGIIESLLKAEVFASLPEAEKQRMRDLVGGALDEITGIHMVIGGAPAGKGLFGVSFVLQCNSAEKVKGLLAEEAKLAQALVQHFGKDNEDIQKLAIRYVKGMETVGAVTADAIVLEHPELEKMEEPERVEMKKVLGEDKIRFLVAAPDAKTVVVTFGGSRDFLAEALKAAGGAGTIGTDPQAAAALKHLPPGCQSLVLFNGGNLFDLVVSGMKVMAPDEELPPFRITCKVPIAMGVGKAGDSAHVVVFVPTKLIQETVGVIMSFRAMAGGGQAKPPLGGMNDF